MKIQHPAWLTPRPHLGHQPIEIRLPVQRPSRGQRPIGIRLFQDLSLEPAVLQWSILRPSSTLSIHSIPGQQPIRMQNADLAWTTLKSGGYINWPSTASGRILKPTVTETPSPDLASPHLLSSNPPTNPSQDRPLGLYIWLIPKEAKDAGGYRPNLIFPLPRAAHPDTRLVIDAAPPEAAALSRAERPPTVLDIAETGPAGETCCPGPSQQRGSHSSRRQSRKRPRNRSSGVFKPKKRSSQHGH